jgi:hypothetical protein
VDESAAKALSRAMGDYFGEIHEKLRVQVRGLDQGTLNWSPLPKANSIAVLVTHLLGSELEMIRSVRLRSAPRDRDSEFRVEADADRLLTLIDDVDRESGDLIASLTAADLTDLRPRGERPPRPGIEWLISNYAHTREHLAQIELTKQLYDSRS